MDQTPPSSSCARNFRARLIAFCGKQWPRYFFLGAIGFIVRLPAIQGPLIWDDVHLARDNPFIKSPLLALEVFRHYLFLDSFSGHYRPVQNLSYMVDYFFWNTDPAGFHLSNILLHVTAGLLLYRLLTHLFGKRGGLWDGNDPRLVTRGRPRRFYHFRHLDGTSGAFRRDRLHFRKGRQPCFCFFGGRLVTGIAGSRRQNALA